MRCAGKKKKQVTKQGAAGSSWTQEDWKCCGKRATHFFKVTYTKFAHERDSKSGKTDDAFGFCDKCAENKDSPNGYWKKGWYETNVHGLRGVVWSVEPIPEFDDKAEKRQRSLAIWISSFVRVMCQRNAQEITEDDWDFILDEAKKIACVTKVFDS
jgi:hypothetical protein